MERYEFEIPVTFKHRVIFTRDVFGEGSGILDEVLAEGGGRRVLVILERGVAEVFPDLEGKICSCFEDFGYDFRGVVVYEGGEVCKADDGLVREVWGEIDRRHIDRHSYVLVIGGGAFLDAVGFAVSTAHRGVRLVRFPTTTLSQDDSGVGVKSAINGFGKKNWIGPFGVPYAVINDFDFLAGQDAEASLSDLIEAVKVALVKDGEFFEWIEENVKGLARLESGVFEECVKRSALAHARHIAAGGDPFETGSSRPLDFGHWAAHKMEALTDYQLSHAEAVSIGVALDTLYSVRVGLLEEAVAERILRVLGELGMKMYHPALDWVDDEGRRRVYEGMDEFREHLGGELTVLMLAGVGRGVDVHEFDLELLGECVEGLRGRWEESEGLKVESLKV